MFKNLPHWYVVTLTLFVIVLVVYFFANIITYVLLAGLLSFAGRPIIKFFKRRKIKGKGLPNSVCALLTILVMLICTLSVVAIFVPLIGMQVQQVAQTDFNEMFIKLQPSFNWVEQRLNEFGVTDFQGQALNDYLLAKMQHVFNFGFISGFLNNIFAILGSFFIGLASIMFILFFFLKDRDLFQRIIILLVDDEYEMKVLAAIDKTKNMLTRYVLGILLQLAGNFAFLSIALGVFGIHNFLLIALLGAVLNIIPYLGPFLGAMVGLIIAITGHLDMDFTTELFPTMIKVMVIFGVDQMLDNYIMQPVIFSKSANAHPLEIFVVILAAGTIGGIGAMIVAIPAYTVFRVIAKEFSNDSKLIDAMTKNL
ncbi:AI-2E family transporter [soil metagenome]